MLPSICCTIIKLICSEVSVTLFFNLIQRGNPSIWKSVLLTLEVYILLCKRFLHSIYKIPNLWLQYIKDYKIELEEVTEA